MARNPMKRGRLRGLIIVQNLLKRLPDSVAKEMAATMEEVRPAAVAMAKAGAPVRTGALRAAIDGKVYAKSLRFRIGLLGKATQRKYFYGYILEVGRMPKTVQVCRHTPSGGMIQYAMKVSNITPRKYDMVGGYAEYRIRDLFREPLNILFDRALRDAARGAGDLND